MAIIIPSKNIYEIDSQKVRKNIADKIKIEIKEISKFEEIDKNINSKSFSSFTFNKDNTKTDDKEAFGFDLYGDSDAGIDYYYSCAKLQYTIKTIKGSFKIFNTKTEAIIKLTDKDTRENPIEYTIDGEKTVATTSAIFSGGKTQSVISDFAIGEKTTTKGILEVPQLPLVVQEINNGAVARVESETIKNKVDFYVEQDGVLIVFDIVAYIEYANCKGKKIVSTGGVSEQAFSTKINGEYCLYNPQKINFTIYGDTIGIDLTDNAITYGNGNNPYSLQGNELLQDSGKVGDISMAEHLAKNVLNEYGKGKETATLLCDINEYYKQPDDYVFNPSGYQHIKNATYTNGIVKQIEKDWKEAQSITIYDFDVKDASNLDFTFDSLGISRSLKVEANNYQEIGNGYFTQNVYFELSQPLDFDIIIEIDTPSGEVLLVNIPQKTTYNYVEYMSEVNNQFDIEFFPISSYVRSIELKQGRIENFNFNKFTLKYNGVELENKTIYAPSQLSFEFKKLMGNSNLSFGVWGYNENIFIEYSINNLNNNETYKFSVNVTNIANGDLTFEDINIESTNNTNLVISTKQKDLPMTFEIGDEVIPMIYNASGNDEPMSKKKDNTAKVFRVVGRDMIYDGSIWQKLYLQEKS